MTGPLPPIGFWSYASSDDSAADQKLSQLRAALADELQLKLGARPKVCLWQDISAIRHRVGLRRNAFRRALFSRATCRPSFYHVPSGRASTRLF
jgi:restriction endonuclease Mrr